MADPRLSKAMKEALIYLLNEQVLGRRAGAYPKTDRTWRALEQRDLCRFDFRGGTGGRHLTDYGRDVAVILLKDLRKRYEGTS